MSHLRKRVASNVDAHTSHLATTCHRILRHCRELLWPGDPPLADNRPDVTAAMLFNDSGHEGRGNCADNVHVLISHDLERKVGGWRRLLILLSVTKKYPNRRRVCRATLFCMDVSLLLSQRFMLV